MRPISKGNCLNMYRSRQSTKAQLLLTRNTRLSVHVKMNTTRTSLANESSSDETNDWNSTGTTTRSSPSWSSSDVGVLTLTTVTVQWIIFVVGTIGNITVLVVLLWRRGRSQVGTQLFVGSLAVSDIGLMLTTVWVKAYGALQTSWKFGVIPCKLQFMCQFLTMNCSIWTLASLSIDRYLHHHFNCLKYI